MLHHKLPDLDSRPLGGTAWWLVPAIAIASALTGAGLLWMAGAGTAALLVLAACIVAFTAAARFRWRSAVDVPDVGQMVGGHIAAAPDYSLIGPILGLSADVAALTGDEGRLLAANPAYRELFDA
jgi:hypothetical protein